MKKYRANADSPVRTEYGIELIAGLEGFEETLPYAAPFQELNQELQTAYTKRKQLYTPVLIARAQLRIAEYLMDVEIRKYGRSVEIADGGRKGPLYDALLPNGLTPVVAPSGVKQVAPTEELIETLTKSKAPKALPVKEEWTPKLLLVLSKLKAAANAYADANKVYYSAFTNELALRDQHELAVERVMGHVRSAFPKDRKTQNIIFPSVDDTSKSAQSEGESDTDTDQPEQDSDKSPK